MKIFNIYPVKNQYMYAEEDYSMILAHLVAKGLYDPKNFNQNRYIIMDNGAYESSRVSTSLKDLIDIARKSGIVIDELVIPDVIGDYEKTKDLYNANYETMKENDDFTYMYVAHVQDLDDLEEAIEMVNNEQDVSLVLGIPKHCKIDRYSKDAIELYKTCNKPIHFLGIKNNYKELLPVKDIIRSCDSAQVSYIARDVTGNHVLVMQERKDPVIDLEKDKIDEYQLKHTKKRLLEELELNGLLR